jgi:hypothetical protein
MIRAARFAAMQCRLGGLEAYWRGAPAAQFDANVDETPWGFHAVAGFSWFHPAFARDGPARPQREGDVGFAMPWWE